VAGARWPFVRSPRLTRRDHSRPRTTFATDHCRFVAAAKYMNIPVIARRVGALGLVFQVLDVCVFLSSL
jgi:hypothetical protein